MTYTVIGVIGHIDHGKTSLVGALTGIDTDTHPEEKRRGITIDLGFASFIEGEHEFALIDAPGHQKYIGNLLAGVAHVDLGLLVVACDQGIEAQTLEHAAILQALGVRRIIVAISRIDLANEAARAVLTEELQLFLADYGFTGFPIVNVSSVVGTGIAELKTQLCRSARLADRPGPRFFRMPIDRIFGVPGRGTVVAGTVWSGTVQIGDMLELAGTGKMVRVRELEVHGVAATRSGVGRRTSLNITGATLSELRRGDELVSESTHRTFGRHVIELSMFRETQPLRCPATVQIHIGTTSCAARVTGISQLEPNQTAVVLVETSDPVVTTFGQHCLLRKPYPVGSFAGGRLLASLPAGRRPKKQQIELGQSLRNADATQRLAAWVRYLHQLEINPVQIELEMGIDPAEIQPSAAAGIEQGFFESPRPGLLVSSEAIARLRRTILTIAKSQAEQGENAWIVEESMVQRAKGKGTVSPLVVRSIVKQLVREQQLVQFNNLLAVASEKTVLSKKQRANIDQILQLFHDTRQPPTTKEIAAQLGLKLEAVESLIRFAAQQRLLTDLGKGFVISSDVFNRMITELQQLFDQQSPRSVAEIRDCWKISRKHAIPLLEHCDRSGITVRSGDARSPATLNQRASAVYDSGDET